MKQLIDTLDVYFNQKAPKLPVKAKDVIVKIVPYIAIIAALLSIPAILALIGLSAVAPAMFYGAAVYHGTTFFIWGILGIVILVLYVMAIPGLFKRTHKSWMYMFYAMLVSALQSLIMLNIISLIIGLIIGFYFLFQIRSYYTTASGSAPQA